MKISFKISFEKWTHNPIMFSQYSDILPGLLPHPPFISFTIALQSSRKLPATRSCLEIICKITFGKVSGNLHKVVCSLVKSRTLFTKGKFTNLIDTRVTLIAGALRRVGTLLAEKVLIRQFKSRLIP